MKEQASRSRQNEKDIACPDCKIKIASHKAKGHIVECKKYIPTYLNNVRRVMKNVEPDQLEFLISEMDLIKQQLIKKIEQERPGRPNEIEKNHRNHIKSQRKSPEIRNHRKEEYQSDKKFEKEFLHELQKQERRPPIDQTLVLEDILGMNEDPFKELSQSETIECAEPNCKSPVKVDDLERFTYLEECLHTICNYCLRNYIRNNYVKKKGEMLCPRKDCKKLIPYYQIKSIVDPSVLNKLQNQLNSKTFNLIECQKCHEQYQFQKGKPSDAPKKTLDGKTITPSKAKHYAQNRFQCPNCRQEQCQSCKQSPYHLSFSCEEYQEHKNAKKCRFCRKVLPKGYMSQSGIKTFDDICDSGQCSELMREACSKRLACGHSCAGFIKEKKCLPCLKEDCAVKISEQLHGENQNSFCSLCYVQALSQAPCVQSKCGHIFHLKCLRKRIELKWGTPRITFKFCECPLCNQWMEFPEECSVMKDLRKYKDLEQKIREKALKRLKHQNQDKDERLTDPKSEFYKNQAKYSMTIYAYFICYDCGQPYFGGRKNCAEAMNQARQGQKFDPKELICAGCCPVEVTDCKKHGKQYISFKCRFCCSVAQWFCWGNTHFCDQCHKKQVSGTYVSRLSKDKLPKCEGKGKCPVGGQHPANGSEYCLGCGICRGDKMDMKDF